MTSSRLAFACLFAAACRIGFDEVDNGSAPDAAVGTVCVGDALRAPSGVTTACAWGCVTSSAPHCGGLSPAGGALGPDDVTPQPGLHDVTLTAAMTTIDGTAGTISGVSGVAVTYNGAVTVFHVGSLFVAGPAVVTGPNAIAIVADGPLVVSSMLAVRQCGASALSPGGFVHGHAVMSPRQGHDGSNSFEDGAGGGANAGNGGSGTNALGGVAVNASTFDLVGGGGGGDANGDGGNGGGAVQLVSNTRIEITGNGTIDARGCDGESGYTDGGGGAGGTALLAAPQIDVDGGLLVDGGRGGTSGGTGGSGNTPDGTSMTPGFGGGGGGIGRILFETRTNALAIGATARLAPLPATGATTVAHDATIE